MADKYCDPSLTTGANDGTSLADAWRSLQEVFTNTMPAGSYAGGDTIHIRTYNAGNITVTLSTGAINQAVIGTHDSPVTWVADPGVKWVGDSGVLRVRKTDDNTYFSFRGVGNYIGTNLNWEFFAAPLAGTHARAYKIGGAFAECFYFKSIKFARETVGTAAIGNSMVVFNSIEVTFDGCYFHNKSQYPGLTGEFANIIISHYTYLRLRDCTFDFGETIVTGPPMIYPGIYGSIIEIVGGKEVNSSVGHYIINGATMTSILSGSTTCNVMRIKEYNGGNAYLPSDKLLSAYSTSTLRQRLPDVYEENVNGINGFTKMTSMERARWSASGNYPTLNATMPDDLGTAWSIQVLPALGVCQIFPAILSDMLKFWNGSAVQVSVTLEMLLKDTDFVGGSHRYDSPTKNDWWIEVNYVKNSDNTAQTETTYGSTAALESSTAGWSATTYGAESYNKHKLTLTTAYAVKADTAIRVTLYSSRPTDNATDFYFVCPDFILSAV